jgi:hypothetical protein
MDWPLTFTRSDYCGNSSKSPKNPTDPGPGSYNAAITLDKGAANGVYCSDVSIDVNDNNLSLNVTLVAPLITTEGNHMTLCPYTPIAAQACTLANGGNLVIWQTGPHDYTFGGGGSGNNSSVNGVIWIPGVGNVGGNLFYDGNSGGFGFWEAQNIDFEGNSYSMIGTGPAVGGTPSTTTTFTTIIGTLTTLGTTTVPTTIPPTTISDTTITGTTTPNTTIHGTTVSGTTTPDTTVDGTTTPGTTIQGTTIPGTVIPGTTVAGTTTPGTTSVSTTPTTVKLGE